MAAKALPSPEVLRQLLRYEPDTGKLFWKERGPEWFPAECKTVPNTQSLWNGRHAGRQAFTASHNGGYLHGSVLGVHLLAHRVIMAIQNGEWPEADVDHINRDRQDNRRENLRLASRTENLRNTPAKRANKSGFKGVYFHAARNKWVAQIRAGGKNNRLGYFKCITAAAVAYAKANRKLHGEFGRIA